MVDSPFFICSRICLAGNRTDPVAFQSGRRGEEKCLRSSCCGGNAAGVDARTAVLPRQSKARLPGESMTLWVPGRSGDARLGSALAIRR